MESKLKLFRGCEYYRGGFIVELVYLDKVQGEYVFKDSSGVTYVHEDDVQDKIKPVPLSTEVIKKVLLYSPIRDLTDSELKYVSSIMEKNVVKDKFESFTLSLSHIIRNGDYWCLTIDRNFYEDNQPKNTKLVTNTKVTYLHEVQVIQKIFI